MTGEARYLVTSHRCHERISMLRRFPPFPISPLGFSFSVRCLFANFDVQVMTREFLDVLQFLL